MANDANNDEKHGLTPTHHNKLGKDLDPRPSVITIPDQKPQKITTDKLSSIETAPIAICSSDSTPSSDKSLKPKIPITGIMHNTVRTKHITYPARTLYKIPTLHNDQKTGKYT